MNKLFAFIPRKYFYWGAIILAIAGGSYWWYSRSQSENGNVQYVTEAAKIGTLISSISASGNVIVDQSSNIDPTITGTVANLAVDVGDEVSEGEFLFNIVNQDLSVSVAKAETSYQQALSSLESAKASKKQARADLDAANSKEKAAAKQKFEAAEASVAASGQNTLSVQAELANQRSKAAERKVVAPIAGTVNAVNIKNGDDLSKLSSGSSREVPVIIGDLQTMKAQVQVNEVDIANVSIGQQVVLTLDAIDALETTGKVEKIDSLGTLDQGVVTYNVTIDFDSLDSRIKPKMSIMASIITLVKQNVLIVPNSSLKNDTSGDYVEINPDSDSEPIRKNVQAGISNGFETEIISGVDAGDNVVTQTIDSNSTSSTASSSTSNKSSAFRLPGLGGGGPRD